MLAMARNRLVVRRRAALGVTVKLLVPPSKVGGLPRTLFAASLMTTLWAMVELVNLTVVLPALVIGGWCRI
jgi:hypothetical protein